MKPAQFITTDPVCGMNVDPESAISVNHNGQSFFFCCEPCRDKFLSAPDNAENGKKSGSCCES